MLFKSTTPKVFFLRLESMKKIPKASFIQSWNCAKKSFLNIIIQKVKNVCFKKHLR